MKVRNLRTSFCAPSMRSEMLRKTIAISSRFFGAGSVPRPLSGSLFILVAPPLSRQDFLDFLVVPVNKRRLPPLGHRLSSLTIIPCHLSGRIVFELLPEACNGLVVFGKGTCTPDKGATQDQVHIDTQKFKV